MFDRQQLGTLRENFYRDVLLLDSKVLTLDDAREYYEILGALEASVVLDVFHQITPDHITKMKQLNLDQKAALEREDYENYYRLNLEFHGVFLDLGENRTLLRLITRQIVPFPQRGGWPVRQSRFCRRRWARPLPRFRRPAG